MRVVRCENPKITEAWCFLLGAPAVFEETDPALIRRFATRSLGELRNRPTFVVRQGVKNAPSAPFWTEEVSWADETHLARFGHRYLSVHFRSTGGHTYTTYAESLRQPIGAWLEALSSFAELSEDDASIQRVGFGYINTFEFDSESFDISEFFRLNFAVEVQGSTMSLTGVESAFQFFDPDEDALIRIEVKIDAGVGEANPVIVRTRVVSDTRVEALGFHQPEEVDKSIYRAKELAKGRFFGLATEKTHELLGVVTDAGE